MHTAVDSTLASNKLSGLETELEVELNNILAYWLNNMVDETHGGFYGKRLWDETLVAMAPKGVVLNARILWTFSAAALHLPIREYKEAAKRSYDYLVSHFIDNKHGGVYWSLGYDGIPADTKKQVYAISFAIYALAEYYRLSGLKKSKATAIQLFDVIEKYSRDKVLGGYIEAFTRDWKPIEDLRLSDKDANEKKTMNTHLHILEAYTNLYRIHPSPEIKEAIIHLLDMFDRHIIDKHNHHLILFFDEAWNRKGKQVSYGHDIEAAWLLCEAAEVIEDVEWINKMNDNASLIADASAEGIDVDHGMFHEYEPGHDHLVKEKHWWPQAEALVGFLKAYEVSGDTKYLEQVFNSWNFIKDHIIDTENGEWIWGVKNGYELMKNEDKAGFWKCPYHNSRACMEVIRRVKNFPGIIPGNKKHDDI